MADINQQPKAEEWLQEPGKIPSMLNVLTILTFIGNGIGIIFAILGYFNAASNYDKVVQAQGKMDEMPGFLKNMMGPDPVGTARLALENRLPVMLLTLAGALLCIYGAMQMRKLKKAGFWTYLIGDLVPFAIIIFMGATMMTGFSGLIGICFTVLFLILYATQLKYMS